MANVTVTVPEEFKEKMEDHPEINWSQVAREAFEEKIADLETIETLRAHGVLDEIAAKSELTEEDVEEMAERIDRTMTEEFLDERT